MRGAVIGGLLFEKQASSVEEAESIIDGGEIELVSGDRASTVGAMAGIVTPSMPVVAPSMQAAIEASDAIELTDLIAEGLRRGDECHNRNVATSVLLMSRLAPALVRAVPSRDDAARVIAFAVENRQPRATARAGAQHARQDAARGEVMRWDPRRCAAHMAADSAPYGRIDTSSGL